MPKDGHRDTAKRMDDRRDMASFELAAHLHCHVSGLETKRRLKRPSKRLRPRSGDVDRDLLGRPGGVFEMAVPKKLGPVAEFDPPLLDPLFA
jgi:hypothetical protein